MEGADETAGRKEIATAKAGNHTHLAVDIDWFVFHINCLCQWKFVNCFPMILNCLHGVVVCQMGHLDQPCSLSSVEICSSTCSVTQDGGKLL